MRGAQMPVAGHRAPDCTPACLPGPQTLKASCLQSLGHWAGVTYLFQPGSWLKVHQIRLQAFARTRKNTFLECDAVKAKLAVLVGGRQAGWLGFRSWGCQVFLVLEGPECGPGSLPRVWLPRTGKEQAGEPEILIAGHVAHESTRRNCTPPPHLL